MGRTGNKARRALRNRCNISAIIFNAIHISAIIFNNIHGHAPDWTVISLGLCESEQFVLRLFLLDDSFFRQA